MYGLAQVIALEHHTVTAKLANLFGRYRFAVTRWWMAQPVANRSPPGQFPVKQGNNREFHRFRIFCGCMTPDKAAEMWGFFAKFPGEGTGNYFS